MKPAPVCRDCPEPVYRRGKCREHFIITYRASARSTAFADGVPIDRGYVVYAWFAPDETCDYVGRGTPIRPKGHRYTEWWTPEHTLQTWPCDFEWQAMRLEGELIGKYLPKRNIEGYGPLGRAEVVRKMGRNDD